jgi:hypothetical protein
MVRANHILRLKNKLIPMLGAQPPLRANDDETSES